jgi:hypothetical protein
LANSRVIGARFETHHRPVAEEAMTAEVQVRRHTAVGATFDSATGRSTYPTPETVYEGPARLQRSQQSEVTRSIGDRQVVIRQVVVSLPVSTPEVRVGDEVRVVTYRYADGGDRHLVGRPLWVHDVRPGSILWQRDLVCLDAPPTAR